MMDEVFIDKPYTFEQMQEMRKQEHSARLSLIMMVTFSAVVLCLFVPLGVWLTRMAMGL